MRQGVDEGASACFCHCNPQSTLSQACSLTQSANQRLKRSNQLGTELGSQLCLIRNPYCGRLMGGGITWQREEPSLRQGERCGKAERVTGEPK